MKEAYKHDYSGDCMPNGTDSPWETFSVGIFQWIPKASGKGLKKSKVVYRVRGNVHAEKYVCRRAKMLCELMDKGFEPLGKSETV